MAVLDKVFGSIREDEPIHPPTVRYKITFLIGGIIFSVLSYFVGTYIYDFESILSVGKQQPVGDLLLLLRRIPFEHPLTFFPWVIGTTSLAVLLGYLFDKQVKMRSRLEVLAVTDGLTLLYNHRYFMQQISLEMKRTQRFENSFGVVILDIDNFKKYNDTNGHLAGDDILRIVAQAVRFTARETDIVARYGGEEFIVLAQGSSKEQTIALGERIRERLEHTTPVTVSVGIATFPEDGKTVNDLITAADQAMYHAKHQGKNLVCLANGRGAVSGGPKTFPA